MFTDEELGVIYKALIGHEHTLNMLQGFNNQALGETKTVKDLALTKELLSKVINLQSDDYEDEE